ncbi:terminase gpA endonuclease subunit [Pseudomonas aeruginosa]
MVVAQAKGRWICDETGIWTRDSIDWFGPDNEPIRTPRSVSFYCWAIYSTWTTWVSLDDEWLKAKRDREKLITFINTTRGEVREGAGRPRGVAALRPPRELPEGAAASACPDGWNRHPGRPLRGPRLGFRSWRGGMACSPFHLLTGDPASEELRRQGRLGNSPQFTSGDGVRG